MTNGEESENADRRVRRILTESRLVHDIDSALDLQNYDRFDIPETEKKIIGVIKEKNCRRNSFYQQSTEYPK